MSRRRAGVNRCPKRIFDRVDAFYRILWLVLLVGLTSALYVNRM
jgi:hypothetical protein